MMTYNNQKTKKKKRLNTKYKKIYKAKQLTWLRIPYKTKKIEREFRSHLPTGDPEEINSTTYLLDYKIRTNNVNVGHIPSST